MIRRAFLKRIAFAALATALFEEWVPQIEEVPEGALLVVGDELVNGVGTITAVDYAGRTITVIWHDGLDDYAVFAGPP